VAELIEIVSLDEVLDDIGDEVRGQIARLQSRIVLDEQGYFEQVRQRMPALTGNAVSAVSLRIEEGATRIAIVTEQADSGVSGDDIARYMPQGILGVPPHTSSHFKSEEHKALRRVGHVVLNPSAAQDPWRQAALDLGHTDFRREGLNPTRISSDPPDLSDL